MDKPNIALSNFVVKVPHLVIFCIIIFFTYEIFIRSVSISVYKLTFYFLLLALYTLSVVINFNMKGALTIFILAGLGPLIFYTNKLAFIGAIQSLNDTSTLNRVITKFLRIISLVLMVQATVGIARPSFVLYEPSYLAIFLLPILYISSIHKIKVETAMHYMFILIVSQSFLLFMFILIMLLVKTVKINAKFATYFVAIVCLTWVLKNLVPRLEAAFFVLQKISGFTHDALITAIILIGGNRLERSMEALITFKENPLFGVGVGNTGAYFSQRHGNEFRFFHTSAVDYVPGGVSNNMMLQLLSEVGLVGSLTIVTLLVFLIYRLLRHGTRASLAFTLCVMTAIMMESTILRIYFVVGIIFVSYYNHYSFLLKKQSREQP